MGDRIDSDMGADVDSAVVGKDNRQRVNRHDNDRSNRNNTHLSIDLHDMPVSESEQREWTTRQIMELRNALIGDRDYGVVGLVGKVDLFKIWLYIIMALMVIMLVVTIWNVVQIQQILQQLSDLAR